MRANGLIWFILRALSSNPLIATPSDTISPCATSNLYEIQITWVLFVKKWESSQNGPNLHLKVDVFKNYLLAITTFDAPVALIKDGKL